MWILNSEETCQALFIMFFGWITARLNNNRARSMNSYMKVRSFMKVHEGSKDVSEKIVASVSNMLIFLVHKWYILA